MTYTKKNEVGKVMVGNAIGNYEVTIFVDPLIVARSGLCQRAVNAKNGIATAANGGIRLVAKKVTK